MGAARRRHPHLGLEQSAIHLARHGRTAFGDEIEIAQGAEIGRPSTLYATARSPEDVEVGGSAVIVARGEFQV